MSGIAFNEYKADSEAGADSDSEGQTATSDDQTDKQDGYITDICQLVRTDIPALGMPVHAKIRLTIIHKIFNYFTKCHLHVLHERMDAVVKYLFTTGHVRNSGSVHSAPNPDFTEDADDTKIDKQPNSIFHWGTCLTLDSEWFINDLSYLIFAGDTFAKSFAPHDDAMCENWWTMDKLQQPHRKQSPNLLTVWETQQKHQHKTTEHMPEPPEQEIPARNHASTNETVANFADHP